MTSVAEGVETFEQLVELGTLGDFAQGVFLGRPEAAELASAFVGQVIPTRTVELVLVCDDDAINRLVNRVAFEEAQGRLHGKDPGAARRAPADP